MSERQETSYTMGQAMRQQRHRDRKDRQRKRSWTLTPSGDMDAVAESRGLRINRTAGGLSVEIIKGQWIAARYWPRTGALEFDGGHRIGVTGLEQAINATADALRLD